MIDHILYKCRASPLCVFFYAFLDCKLLQMIDHFLGNCRASLLCAFFYDISDCELLQMTNQIPYNCRVFLQCFFYAWIHCVCCLQELFIKLESVHT